MIPFITDEDYPTYGNEDSYLDASYEDRFAGSFDIGEWYGDDYLDSYPEDEYPHENEE